MQLWRIICLFVSFLGVFFWTGPADAQAATPLNIAVDGKTMETDVPPFIDANSRTMVPVRFISEALGFHVGWDSGEQRIRVSRPGTIVELYIGQQTAHVNGAKQEMDTVAVLKEGRTMVPLRFLAETFGLKVSWEQEQRTVVIKTPAPPAPPAAGPRFCTVTGNVVNIRSGPGTDYSRLTQVTAGTRLTILAEKDAWYQVGLPGGIKGWIAGWLVELQHTTPTGDLDLRESYGMPPSTSRLALVMKESVNVRSGPGLTFPVLSKVNLGEQLPIAGEKEGWFAVRLPSGQSGWVAGWLVAVRYDTDKQVAVADPDRSRSLISRWNPVGHIIPGDMPTITGVEVERSGSAVLLKVSAAAPLALPGSFRLENPSRLVFDFTAQLVDQAQPPTLQVNHGPVDRFRLGQFDEQTVRIVADLQGPASYAMTQSPDGRVITIQIRPVDPSGRIIVIDPGHGALNEWGSSDPGAIGPTGLKERDVVRSISLELGNILLNEGFTVIYTRESDTGLTLEDRAMVASISGAELLVSIHANASTNRATSGTMTFYHAPPGADQSQLQARKMLAGFIQAELLNRLQREDKGVREANFLILRSCPIPAALVEVAYISNPVEEKLLADPAFQRRAAEAIALGIKRYLAANHGV